MSLKYEIKETIESKEIKRKTRISELVRETLALHNMSSLIEHVVNNIKHLASGRANPGSSEAT